MRPAADGLTCSWVSQRKQCAVDSATAQAATCPDTLRMAAGAGLLWWCCCSIGVVVFADDACHAQDELAKSVTTEQGKTFQDAKGDVFRGLGGFQGLPCHATMKRVVQAQTLVQDTGCLG